MVLVTVRDSDPLVEMKCSEIDPRTLHQQRGSLVKKGMDSVQEHCPNFDEPLYRCLQSPDEWLNNYVLVQFVKHLQYGMLAKSAFLTHTQHGKSVRHISPATARPSATAHFSFFFKLVMSASFTIF